MKLFLAGDVMTGRGIDQILAHPGDPTLYETWVTSATEYVRIAEQRNGPISRPAEPSYIWGEALAILDDREVDARIINLETAVTDRGEAWPQKGINYRMHPENIDCITAADIDCCVLANNHVLDWSHDGLEQTLETLADAGIAVAGAGHDSQEAWSPAVVEVDPGRILVIGIGMTSSGIPRVWTAEPNSAGVALGEVPLSKNLEHISRSVGSVSQEGDLVVVSIHWGPNWGYDIPSSHREFARALIDEAGADVVHGHSSHHPLGIEVYRNRPILYGCGDLINDYEGIGGHEEYRSDLRALYLLDFEEGSLDSVELVPMRTKRFSLARADSEESAWMARKLSAVSDELELGTHLEADDEGSLKLEW